jgi:general secretion pathway protein B
MSYILEALKKADRERAAGHVPDLETVHHQQPVPRRSRRWLWVLGLLFVSNGILVALLAVRDDDGRDAIPRSAPGDRIAALPEPARLQPRVESPPPVRLPPANDASVAPPAPARQPQALAPRMAPAVRPATVRDTALPTVIEQRPVPAARPPLPAPTSSRASMPSTDAAPESGTVPDWNDLPLDFRSRLSMPRMDVHVYDPNPQRRFVLIDLQKVREGDRLPNGAVLEKILPDGIQLSYQGTRFRYGK